MPKVFAGNYADIFDIKGKKAVVVGGAGGFGSPRRLPSAAWTC
mgnify:CR=1 FL=1